MFVLSSESTVNTHQKSQNMITASRQFYLRYLYKKHFFRNEGHKTIVRENSRFLSCVRQTRVGRLSNIYSDMQKLTPHMAKKQPVGSAIEVNFEIFWQFADRKTVARPRKYHTERLINVSFSLRMALDGYIHLKQTGYNLEPVSEHFVPLRARNWPNLGRNLKNL